MCDVSIFILKVGGQWATYNITLVVGLDLGNVGVDEVLEVVARAVDAEALLAEKLSRGQQDVLDEGDETVALSDLGGSLGLTDLLGDNFGGVEEIDLAVGVGGRHLGALETGDHGVHDMGAL